MKLSNIRALVGRHRFPFAIGAVVIISILMTAVSLSLYVTSGTARLDLSRPGYESVRQDVQQSPGETYNSDGPVNEAALNEFDQLLQKRRTNLDALGGFEDTTIDDESLRLAPPTP